MEIIPLSPDTAALWDGVVNQSAEGWLYGLSAWQKLICGIPEWGYRDCSFAVSENGTMLAVMPLQWMPNKKCFRSTAMGPSGPVLASGLSDKHRGRVMKAVVEHIRELGRQFRVGYLTVSLPPLNRANLWNVRGVNWLIHHGFSDISTHTYITNLLRPESALWSELAQLARRQIKQAISDGYTVQRERWMDRLDDYYRVHVETYRRTGATPHPRSYFDGIAKLAEKGYGVLWVGRDSSGRAVAFHNCARYGRTSLYWTGCSETAHLESGINYLLFWQAILGARADGCEWYEPGEAFPGTTHRKLQGLTEFKSRFGGELHRFFKGNMSLTPEGLVAGPRAFHPTVQAWLRAGWHVLASVFRRKFGSGRSICAISGSTYD